MILTHSQLEIDLGDIPETMTFRVDKVKLVKLVRNADDVTLFVADLNTWIKPQKSSLQAALAAAGIDCVFLATFNGLDLKIYGELETDEGEGAA